MPEVKPIFVVQEHRSTHLHFDFRLEMDGMLKSWAVPKGPSMNPKDKRLAIMVADHVLEYGSFEGTIREGQYGAGLVMIWDRGHYDMLGGSIESGKIEFALHGRRLRGVFVLARMAGKNKEWLLIKKKDAFSTSENRKNMT